MNNEFKIIKNEFKIIIYLSDKFSQSFMVMYVHDREIMTYTYLYDNEMK